MSGHMGRLGEALRHLLDRFAPPPVPPVVRIPGRAPADVLGHRRREPQTDARRTTPATEAMRTVRNPNRRSSEAVAGLTPALPTNTAVTNRPDSTGDRPKPSWNSGSNRRGIVLVTTRQTKPPEFAAR